MSVPRPSAGIVDLVTGAEAASAFDWMTLAGVVMVMAGLGVLAVLIRRRNGRNPAATAFGRLARRMSLSRRQRIEVRVLAAKCGVAPVSLLLSASALAAARAGVRAN